MDSEKEGRREGGKEEWKDEGGKKSLIGGRRKG